MSTLAPEGSLGVIINPSNFDRPAVVAFDQDGAPVALAKISASEYDRHRQGLEWEILRTLNGVRSLRETVPRPVDRLEGSRTAALLTDAKVGAAAPTVLSMALRNWLDRCVQGDEIQVADSSLATRLMGGVDAACSGSQAIPGGARLALSVLGDTRVPRTIVHGDFTPWNVVLSKAGPHVFDWEWGCIDGVPGWDAAYFGLQVGLVKRAWGVPELVKATRELVRAPTPPYSEASFRALLVLVLAQIALVSQDSTSQFAIVDRTVAMLLQDGWLSSSARTGR